ncbi:MAG TPA: cyclodeaminase/cyclohydrolase family protein [Clostridiaceae bacterium]|jgi:formiminotetrahydrofolate cyclodeaminase|nr:cyclodeaminase/cyclohydrolase family protein [Clostridiaceae bacterium]
MLVDLTCVEFADKLAAKTPVPGGGGASAMAGALGAALGSMVCNYTIGKKKYKNVEEDVKLILEKAALLQSKLLSLVDKDAVVFEPLSKAYAMPENTEEEKNLKEKIMEEALVEASKVPMEIMEAALEAIGLHEELLEKGSKMLISDVGVGVILCKAALQGAALNVFINTGVMKNRSFADLLNERAKTMLETGITKADNIYKAVEGKLCK